MESSIYQFKKITKRTKMIKGKMNLIEPSINSKTIIPDLILAPCVAFDKYGNRLGYGGGYYDYTINELRRKNKKLNLIVVGFSDQEVEKIIPEAVTERENGYKAVQYEKLIPLLVECVKEQQDMIEKLQNDINVLKK